jgi:hypothetical protein
MPAGATISDANLPWNGTVVGLSSVVVILRIGRQRLSAVHDAQLMPS